MYTYYILRLLFLGQYPSIFKSNPAQAKQWVSSYEELYEITKLFTALSGERLVKKAFAVFFQSKYQRKKTMLVSAKQFLA